MQATVAKIAQRRSYAAGGKRIPADYAGLDTARDVAAFASDEGPVYGTADGQLVAPLAPTQKWDVAGKASNVELVEIGNHRLAVWSLV